MTSNTKNPITTDGWYEHTDGTFGYYTGAARVTGPRLTVGPCRDFEAVHRDDRGAVLSVGWPALRPLIDHLGLADEDALRGVSLERIARAIFEIKQHGAALATIEER